MIDDPVTDDPLLAAAIGARWVAVRRRIEEAAAAADRDPAEVRVVAVTKGFGPDVVRAALAAGLSRFGENRVQEGEGKVAAAPEAEWHLIGHLQSNKVRRAVAAFGWLEGVDSVELLARLDRAAAETGRRPQVLLQVNVAEAESQHGLAVSSLVGWARAAMRSEQGLVGLASADVVGLMAIGPMTDDPAVSRGAFGTVRPAPRPAPGGDRPCAAGAVDGHERRSRGRGPGGRHPRPRRDGAVRRATRSALIPGSRYRARYAARVPVVITFFKLLSTLLWVLILARVIISWTNPQGGGALVAFVYQVTEPILAPIRRLLPPTSGIDWSPLIAMLILGAISRVVYAL